MTITHNGPTSRKPLRLWPGVVIVTLQWLLAFVVPLLRLTPKCLRCRSACSRSSGGALGGLAVVVWWLLFSRAPWSERLGAIVLIVVAMSATRLVRPPVDRDGRDGDAALHLVDPVPEPRPGRLGGGDPSSHAIEPGALSMVAAIVLACAPWTLVRTAGVGGSGSEFHWRWTPTPEQRLLAQTADEPKPLPPPPAPAESPAGTAGRVPRQPKVEPAAPPPRSRVAHSARPSHRRRARERSGQPSGLAFADPSATASSAACASRPTGPRRRPSQMWRRPIGPGWSSFAVSGDRLYTQEQRGDDEIVACYKVSTGEPVWRHRDRVRFWESEGGAGPRGTPTAQQRSRLCALARPAS